MSKLLVLYGATGATGSHILRMALEDGLRVRAYVRSPDKIPAELREHSALEVSQGDFTDADGVQAALEGADMVICAGGGPVGFQKGLMMGVVTNLIAGMRTHGVKRLVYQAGAFSPAPGTQNPLFVRWVLRPILGTIFGISAMLAENDEVMAYVAGEARDLNWTFTRPGQIVEEPSKGKLNVSDKMSTKCHFVDLARLNLDLVQSDEQIHQFPYVDY